MQINRKHNYYTQIKVRIRECVREKQIAPNAIALDGKQQ